jgi:hypothetical protein
MRDVLALRLLPALVAIALTAGTTLAAVGPPTAAAGSERLPDLDQAAPSGLTVTRAGNGARAVYRLGFASAVDNVGDGPLVIRARRRSADTASMMADQVIQRDGAPAQLVEGAGRLRYVVSPDHRHWHLLGFDRYELRRAGRTAPVVRDHKSGFCLGDRYAVSGRAPRAAPPEPVYTRRCGLGQPGRLAIQEGISVGYGDNYKANLEGQYLRLSGLRAGRFVLVHRVNADRGLRELDYRNNAASLLLELRWSRGEPLVRVLRVCPRTDRCDR